MSTLAARLFALVAVAFVAACTAVPSPTQSTTWRDPNFQGRPFSKLLVIGLSTKSLRDLRGFEDQLVEALRQAGIGAEPGWRYAPPSGLPDEAALRAAVVQAGAEGALMVRMGDFATEGEVGYSPGVVTEVAPNVYAGWYVPGIAEFDYQAANIFTTLFDARTMNPIWTYNPPTTDPGTLRRDGVGFANDVVSRLLASGLVMAI